MALVIMDICVECEKLERCMKVDKNNLKGIYIASYKAVDTKNACDRQKDAIEKNGKNK